MLSPRLRSVVGVGFEAITEPHLQALVDLHVSEDQDLDFKESWYDRGPKGSFELPKDVAAFANQVGGLLIVGVKDRAGVATALTPMKIEGEQEPGIRQLLASRVFPMVQGVGIRVIRKASTEDLGYYLLAIPRSVDAPHGVLSGGTGDEKRAMCWPVRNGTSTRYLAEAELAARYRDRFALLRGQVDRLTELHSQGDSRREPGHIVALLVDMALAPGMPGYRALTGDSPTIADFLNGNRWGFRALKVGDLNEAKIVARRRRLRVETGSYRFELHGDGAGWARTFVGIPAAGHNSPLRLAVDDFEQKLRGLVALLGDFACWAGASGDCLLAVRLGGRVSDRLLLTSGTGGRILSEPVGAQVPPVELTVALDGLFDPAIAGRAAYLLARDLEQDLGVPEPVALKEDGSLNLSQS